ncbi:class I SAM-dependent methyltransferase [Niveispirillum sp. SYP-B3756]|uniref:class I SAM-dependent methyltransferase n=1 Tax=Niveispirillum sp. SYP-B3756 TaxID=2662178 RepID=UPI0015659475|nr:class I SAM-dependent methyltransferase [Niveispirillum sp. SYP-B3756]
MMNDLSLPLPDLQHLLILGQPDGGDLAVNARRQGIQVSHHDLPPSPARTLALLEGAMADGVALDADTLRALLPLPALDLADLSHFRDLLVAGSLSPVEQAAVTALFGTPPRPLLAAPARDWQTLAELAAAVTADAEASLTGIDLAQAVAVADRLADNALLSMLNGLSRCGLFTGADSAHSVEDVLETARVAPSHRGLIRRWLRVLVERGRLRWSGGRLCAVPPATAYGDAALKAAWDGLERDWRAVSGSARTIDYARANAAHLPELLRGERQAVHLLFPEGRIDLAAAIYSEPVAARYQHHSVRALVSRLAAAWTGAAPLRLLEVGGGTGATTRLVLPSLAGLPVDYLFTDLSRFFLDQVATWQQPYPFVRRGLYDLDKPPEAQGIKRQSLDIIISGGALNAARNTDASIGWLRDLLRPGGWLILTEPTREEVWVMASQAFMMGQTDDERQETQATFLSLAQWNRVLEAAGLVRVLGLPDHQHPLSRLGHRVFAARKGAI